ncbi:MAG: NAD(+) diphosphatase [Pararhizobium sp.]
MSSSLFDRAGPHEEPSALVAFSGNRLDRRSENRPDDCAVRALEAEGAKAYAIGRGRVVFRMNGGGLEPAFAPSELADLAPDTENAVLLGFADDGTPRLAIPVGVEESGLPDEFRAVEYRSLYTDALVEPARLGEVAQAGSLVAWNRSAAFCGRCGAPTASRAGGSRRECAGCGALFFPRTDPVVIMLAVDEENDLCLLGRSPHFKPGMYSCLAGFLEPGETIEEAVRRETLEESGIVVGRVRYHASQPWPMPHTLMIGAFAEATTRTIGRDTVELEDCRWFTRGEVAAMLERAPGEGRSSPPVGAIAHRLMRDWVEWR